MAEKLNRFQVLNLNKKKILKNHYFVTKNLNIKTLHIKSFFKKMQVAKHKIT
jgi:hypothetical protein